MQAEKRTMKSTERTCVDIDLNVYLKDVFVYEQLK